MAVSPVNARFLSCAYGRESYSLVQADIDAFLSCAYGRE